jgi:predicted AAA+ superfamily ATPase
VVAEALGDTRVVLVNGARQAGKSTLTRLTAGSRPATLTRLLDDPATLRAAHDDPTDFVDHDGLMVIDEISWRPSCSDRSRYGSIWTRPRGASC